MALQDNFDIGDGIRVTATFTDFTGVQSNPTITVFKVRDPSGAVTLPTVHQLDTGIYYADFVVDQKGTWAYRWEGDGALQAAEEGVVTVRASHFS